MGQILRLLILPVFLIATQPIAHALTLIKEYPNAEPTAVLSDVDNQFYMVGGRQVWRLDSGFKPHVHIPEMDNQFTLSVPHVRIGRQGAVFAVSTGSHTKTETVTVGKKTETRTTTTTKLYLIQCAIACAMRSFDSTWKLQENHFVTTPQGDVLLALYREKTIYPVPGDPAQVQREYQYYVNHQPTDALTYRHLYAQAFADDLFVDDDDGFEWRDKPVKDSHAHRIRGTRTIVWDNDHQPHIFFHDPGTRSMHQHYFSRETHNVIHRDVDDMESGVENAVIAEPGHLWALHYYYRDNFNKGIAATVMGNDGAITEQFVVDAGIDINIGWDLRATRASNGRVLLTYRADSQNGGRRYWLLENADELHELGRRLHTYGTVTQGDGDATALQAEVGQQLVDSLYKSYKWYALSLGTGLQYAFWNYKFAGALNYELDNSVVNLLEVGGQLRGFNFGLEYAKHLAEIGQSNAATSRLSSYFSWNRLLFDFDFKLGLENSATDVSVNKDGALVKKYRQHFSAVNLTLLTPRQNSFGIRYQRYNQFKTITKQHIDAGSKQWYEVASGVGELDEQTFGAHFGYSTVDYLLKFETASRQYYADFSGEIGLLYERFKGDDASAWGATPSLSVVPYLGGMAEVGHLWYRRWNTRFNIGGLIKVAYRLNFNLFPGGDKDKEDDEVSNSDTNYYTNKGMILRHGPLVFVAVVF